MTGQMTGQNQWSKSLGKSPAKKKMIQKLRRDRPAGHGAWRRTS
jgi:hypothetical protein